MIGGQYLVVFFVDLGHLKVEVVLPLLYIAFDFPCFVHVQADAVVLQPLLAKLKIFPQLALLPLKFLDFPLESDLGRAGKLNNIVLADSQLGQFLLLLLKHSAQGCNFLLFSLNQPPAIFSLQLNFLNLFVEVVYLYGFELELVLHHLDFPVFGLVDMREGQHFLFQELCV